VNDESRATRTSGLAAFCLIFGLGAAAMVTVAACGAVVMNFLNLFMAPTRLAYEIGYIATIIVAASAALPAVVAIILWIAARAAVRESQGTLRGMALYRTGMLLVILSVLGAAAGRSSVIGASVRGLRYARETYPDTDAGREAEAWFLRDRFRTMLHDRVSGASDSFARRFMEDVRPEMRDSIPERTLRRYAAGELVYLNHARVLRVDEARTALKGVGRFDEVLARESLRPEDLLVVVPIREVDGLKPEEIARAFLVGVEGENQYVYYVFRERDHERKALYLGPRTSSAEFYCERHNRLDSKPGRCPDCGQPLKRR
jgi:hypothetical protein